MVEPKRFKNILVAVDDSDLGQLALVNAIHQAQEDGSKLTIVSFLEPNQLNTFDVLSKDKLQAAQQKVQDDLKRFQKQALDAGVADVQPVYAEGEPGEEIVKNIIDDTNADLVVMGAHSKKSGRHYFGSQSNYVANHAEITVMIVR
ncbi:nucleotide-binding universal stress UspA family protein [Weissella uvarum]|uniref:universal stress protein n=1 Tax=Weissella uvarum TaxID=1479233 RepID=UPI00195FFEE1|nr:universal stress protein [Weissella uvarum]MBM7616665.1 nucleotide-binding universal stress UspA family protein [Weissella uvarum]MCM0594879.1 universal stress protein [Weissella uvarum]